MIYLIASLEVIAGKNQEYIDILQNEYIPLVVDRYGWKLVACWQTQIGDVDEIVDIWAFDSLAQFERTRQAMFKDTEYKEIRKRLRSLLKGETIKFTSPLACSPLK